MTTHLITGFIIGVAVTLFIILFIKVKRKEKQHGIY